jgi:hypothetical protein
MGPAPEGEPLICGGNLRAARRPLSAARASWLLVGRTPARPRPRRLALARLCSPCFLPRLRGGQVGGRARLWPPIRTVILSYAKHGRCQANAQGRTRLLSFPAARKQVGGSKLVASALRLGIPQRPASVSGPRVVRKCNGAVASRVRAGAKSHGVAKRKPVNAADHQGPAWAAPISPISQSDCRTRPSPFSRPRFPAKAWSNDP